MLKRIIVLAAVAGMFAAFAPSSQAAGEEAFRIWSRNTDGDETRTKFISIPFAHIYRSTTGRRDLRRRQPRGRYPAFALRVGARWGLLGVVRPGQPVHQAAQLRKATAKAPASLDLLTIGSGRRGGDVGSLYQRWHEGDRSGNRFLMFGTGRDSRVPE
jgi:hypothetical protein